MDINKKNNEKQLKKAFFTYLILSAVSIAIDKIYSIFGHGVNSASMTWMFLYPLIGGGLIYFIILQCIPSITKFVGYRLFFNLYNSGIATLTLGSLLKGIFEIAGTNSTYLVYYYMTGGILITVGLVIMLIMVIKRGRLHI